jgi:C4-dicarboxylate-specific signal transduction histidine kinase
MERTDAPPRSRGTEFDVGTFVRAAAHEIAGQINAISMNAELVKLLLERSDVARADETIKRMLSDCGRYGRMVRGLERFGACMTARERERVKVGDLIEAATMTYAQERSGAKPALQVEADDVAIVVDRIGMQRVLGGLLHNAAEAGAAAISVQARRDADGLVIAIADDGPGIADNIRARAAEPFFTTRRDAGHNGLGLTLAAEMLSAHGGVLSIDKNEPRGTRIGLRLPLA